MGIRDYFVPSNLCLVEWPERGEPLLTEPDISLKLAISSPSSRTVTLSALTPKGALMLLGIAE